MGFATVAPLFSSFCPFAKGKQKHVDHREMVSIPPTRSERGEKKLPWALPPAPCPHCRPQHGARAQQTDLCCLTYLSTDGGTQKQNGGLRRGRACFTRQGPPQGHTQGGGPTPNPQLCLPSFFSHNSLRNRNMLL